MEVHGDAVCPAQPVHQMAMGLAEHGRRTVGAIHMKPQAFALGKICEQIQVIVSPAAGGAGAAHQRHHATATPLQLSQRPIQAFCCDVVSVIRGDQAHAFCAPTHDADRPVHAVVRLFRTRAQPLTVISVRPRVVLRACMPPPGRQQGHQIGECPSVTHHATTPLRQSHLTANPRHQHLFHRRIGRSHFIDGSAVVEQVGHHAYERAVRKWNGHLVAHVSGVLQPVRAQHHLPHQLGQSFWMVQPVPPRMFCSSSAVQGMDTASALALGTPQVLHEVFQDLLAPRRANRSRIVGRPQGWGAIGFSMGQNSTEFGGFGQVRAPVSRPSQKRSPHSHLWKNRGYVEDRPRNCFSCARNPFQNLQDEAHPVCPRPGCPLRSHGQRPEAIRWRAQHRTPVHSAW